jgi:diamine N-acetyltransferase
MFEGMLRPAGMGGSTNDVPTDRPPLEGAFVRLRPVEENDLAWINREFWNPRVSEFLLVVWPEWSGGTRSWWESIRADPGAIALMIETHDGRPVGIAALERISQRSRTAELGIWVAEGSWGQGLGTDAVRTLCRFGFREMNLRRVELRVFEPNERARRAYERVGFVLEGRQRKAHFVGGRHVDVLLMGLLAEELRER